ncbi:MAG: DUF4236 domain-containing protein [Anaerolineae bacterium]|nr:DUF4236 domain-containing protein [Anaerolineae bacterium]
MGFRFRRSIKIAPGVKMHVGKRGPSSIGAGGFNFGKRGVHHNINIPGTGISYRYKVAGKSRSKPKTKPQQTKVHKQKTQTEMAVEFKLQDDGSVICVDKKGKPLPEILVQEAKKQNREIIIEWLDIQAANYNAEIAALTHLHLGTPAPNREIVINPQPELPKLKKEGIVAKLFNKSREKIEKENEAMQLAYEKELKDWEEAEKALRTNPEVMSTVLSSALSSIEWPRETLVSFDIIDEGRRVMLDVDLPEIEDLPFQEAKTNKSQLSLTIKDISQRQQRLNYLSHIHAIGFRFIGEVFAHLPSVSEVVFSGFSQRVSKQTAHVEDEYLYSVRVKQDLWQRMNFDNLENLNVVECFEQFDVRRKITSTGIITPIEPFEVV